ncbi:hypothetical protein [Streptomyces sp. NPDC002133]|uniref:hypothetical protein n=1 Tax=Streptomyces sp. NPDC002133 TaxID=3154409 RepID=UPI0033217B68
MAIEAPCPAPPGWAASPTKTMRLLCQVGIGSTVHDHGRVQPGGGRDDRRGHYLVAIQVGGAEQPVRVADTVEVRLDRVGDLR